MAIHIKNDIGDEIQEITGNITPFEANTTYKFKGIVSCIGLIIKVGKPNDFGGLDYVSAIAIHVIDGVDVATSHHVNAIGLTDIGKDVLTEINTCLDSNKEMEFQITYVYSPERGEGKKDFSTTQLIEILNDNFSQYSNTEIIEKQAIDGSIQFNSKMD